MGFFGGLTKRKALLNGYYPVHDIYMGQVDDWYDENGRRYRSVGCDMEGCGVRAIGIEVRPLMLLGQWQHLLG